jgi:2-phosphoglycerate kinase
MLGIHITVAVAWQRASSGDWTHYAAEVSRRSWGAAVNDSTRRRPEHHAWTADAAAPRALLRHVYWIGGGSGAGKSTIARRIAARYGLQLYATDDVMSDHATRSTPEDSPFLNRFKAMNMDERWVNRSPATMLETFHWFRGERFSLIVEDLLRLPTQPGVIVEGFRLLPHLVKPLLAMPSHAAWLLPTPDFRRAAIDSRGSTWDIAQKTSDPEKALHNLLERDRMFTRRLYEETKHLELRVVKVDLTMT